jgi:type II secretory pathway component PulK
MTMALVLVTTLAITVTALADYVQTSLRATRVAAAQTQRLTAADGALRLAVESLKQSSASCSTNMVVPSLNGTSVTVRCTPNGPIATGWSRHDLTATVELQGGTSTGRATVQITRSGGGACMSSCTVTINSWVVE